LGKFIEDFGTDGIALHADVGANESTEVGGLGTKGFVHGAYAYRNGSLHTTSPTCMDGTGGMMGRVVEEDGNAVGGADTDTYIWEVGKDDVDAFESRLLGRFGLTEVITTHLVGLDTMDLMGQDDVGGIGKLEGVGQELTIAKDGLGVIA
jgi:hypothetical protein